jgi:hypothetical protein
MAEPNEDDIKHQIKQISTEIDNILNNIEKFNTTGEGKTQKPETGALRNI